MSDILIIGLHPEEVKTLEWSMPSCQIEKCTADELLGKADGALAVVLAPDALSRPQWDALSAHGQQPGAPMILMTGAPGDDLKPNLPDFYHIIDLNSKSDTTLRRASGLLELAVNPCWDCHAISMDDTLRSTMWNDGWYLLDIETSGKNPLVDDIIAVSFAYMANYEIKGEYSTLVKPLRPISEKAERITGITNEQLYDAMPLGELIRNLTDLEYPYAPFLFTSQAYMKSFLSAAYHACGKQFNAQYLSVDALAARLFGYTLMLDPSEMLDAIGCTRKGASVLQDPYLAEIYNISLAVFHGLKERFDVRAPGDFDKLYGEGMVD